MKAGKMALMPERYPVDGSFESYSRLMRDASRGVPEAIEAIRWYQQYQELSRNVRLNKIPPPPQVSSAPAARAARAAAGSVVAPWNGGNGGSYTVASGGGKAVVPAGAPSWIIRGEPTEAEMKELQQALDKMYPKPVKPHVHCDIAGCDHKPPYSPDGVHITSHQRIGDEVRNTYLDHLGTMFSEGRIPQDEYEARSDAAVKAQTKEQLEALIQDLPSVLVRKELPPEPVIKHKMHPALAFLMCLTCLSVAFSPGIGVMGIVFIIGSALWGSIFLGSLLRPFIAAFLSGMKGSSSS
jgi:hypothetical protein